jgi:hypothetical protein
MGFLREAFSDKGQPSSARLLMGVFSLFSMFVLWRIISHMLRLSDTGHNDTLTIWLSNLPLLITSLCVLIALPYSVGKGAGAISDLANMVSSLRGKNAGTPADKG